MNDGRLRSSVQRVGLMVACLGILMCLRPDGNWFLSDRWGGSASRNAYGEAAAAAPIMVSASAAKAASQAAEVPITGSGKGKDYAEAEAALGRIKVKPFEQLDISRLERVEVTATGYTAGKESTGKSPGHPEYGITYSGVKVRKDDFSTIAADPAVFPIGTIMYVPGYGFGVVADTGSAIKGKKIDLFFKTKEQVYREWGKRKVNVYILRKGDGKVTEAMMNRLNGLTKTVPVDSKTNSKTNSKTAK